MRPTKIKVQSDGPYWIKFLCLTLLKAKFQRINTPYFLKKVNERNSIKEAMIEEIMKDDIILAKEKG